MDVPTSWSTKKTVLVSGVSRVIKHADYPIKAISNKDACSVQSANTLHRMDRAVYSSNNIRKERNIC